MAEPRPTDLFGTAGVLAGIAHGAAPPRGRAPVGRRRSRGKRAPEPGAAPARRPARLSRNPRSAPVPDARALRVPQIPQLRIPQSRIRAPRRSARFSRNSRSAPVPDACTPRIPQIPQLRIPQSRIRTARRPARFSRNPRSVDADDPFSTPLGGLVEPHRAFVRENALDAADPDVRCPEAQAVVGPDRLDRVRAIRRRRPGADARVARRRLAAGGALTFAAGRGNLSA